MLHPSSVQFAVTRLTVEIERTWSSGFEVCFRLEGDVDAIRFEPPGPIERGDRLWESTCFEIFAINPTGIRYEEINLSPSRKWAGYSFAGYRSPILAEVGHVAEIETSISENEFRLQAISGFSIDPSTSWLCNLSAVIEEKDGNISYWALTHPPGKPDFHHRDCFTLELPAAETS